MGLQDELTAALDADRVTAGADERHRHGTDEGWHATAEPDLVVYPRSSEEAAAIVRICAAHHAPVIPFGAGTSLEGHVAALEGGVSVDMSQMDAITRLSIEDMDVTVQAGVTRRQLDERLRPEGVFFSVDRFPDVVEPIAWLLPMTHVIEVVRPLTAGQPQSLALALLHMGYVTALAAVAFTLSYRRLRVRLFD